MKRLLTIVAIMFAIPSIGRADIMSEMQDMIGTMSNYSPPGVYETRSRGIIAGGNLNARSRVKQVDLVSFVPPSFKAGCGGIDFYFGSLGFVNAEQFTELLRNIAQNAIGYAFYVALDVTCDTCKQTIETLQQKIQALNQHFGNSCQLARGLVTDVMDAKEGKELSETGLVNTTKGVVSGIFDAMGDTSSNPIKTMAETMPEEDKKFTGNLMWKALKEQDVAKWYAFGDDSFLQVIMSVTGTIVVKTDQAEGVRIKHYIQGNVRLHDLLYGSGELTYLRCKNGFDADECTELDPMGKMPNFYGLSTAVERMLLGKGGGIMGVLEKIARNVPLSDQERNFVSSMDGVVGTMLIRLAKHSLSAAQHAAHIGAGLVTREMAVRLMTDMINTANAAAAGLNTPEEKALADRLDQVRSELQEDAVRVAQDYGSPGTFLGDYYNYIGFTQQVHAGVRGR